MDMEQQNIMSPEDAKDARNLAARLEMVVHSLTATIFFNPIGMLVMSVALVLGGKTFGDIPTSRIAAAYAVQCFASAVTWVVQRRNIPLDQNTLKRTQWEMVAVQAFGGLSWGVVGWLWWRDGNAANNVYVAMIMVCIMWSVAFTRAALLPVVLSAVVSLTLPFTALFATGSGAAARVLLVLIPLWSAYLIVIGILARRRVEEVLKERFANEDLSEALRQARDEAVRKRFDAEAANQSKTVFLANMSHELRTPLNAILGFSEIIASQKLGRDNPRYQDYARDIHDSGSHLLTLINDILDVAKIEAGKMEIDPRPLDIADVMANIERLMVVRTREKNQQLAIIVDDHAFWPVADERAFKQIVLNLLSNALKFTPAGGQIDVTCGRGDNGGYLLTVKDTGPGIAPDKLERVFIAFTQVDNRYDRATGGTGLGLAMVQGLAHLHGGRAWIDSELGKGTKVSVYFPLGTAQPVPRRASA
jgi:two-component system, cell cycle sensor histidine kinase PleC